MAATGQCPDHDALIGGEVGQDGSSDVTQTARDLMPFDGVADRLGDNQSDPGSITGARSTSCVHDDVRLRRSHPVLDGGAELRRPCHPVLSREHAA